MTPSKKNKFISWLGLNIEKKLTPRKMQKPRCFLKTEIEKLKNDKIYRFYDKNYHNLL